MASEDLDEVFTHLVRTHQDAVFALARRLCRSRADAEDLAAEALLRAWRSLRSGGSLPADQAGTAAWLCTVLLNEHRNRLRTASRRPLVSGHEPPESPSPLPGPQEQVVASADRRRLEAALDALPEKQRVAVVLRHVMGFGTDEIAQVLRCPAGTARSHLSRGLAGLRAHLDGGTDD